MEKIMEKIVNGETKTVTIAGVCNDSLYTNDIREEIVKI